MMATKTGMKQTQLGRLVVDEPAKLHERAVRLVLERAEAVSGDLGWALSGGSTTASFYRALVEPGCLPSELLERVVWTTSDERCVPLASPESNFGQAARGLLDPLGIPGDRRVPWPVDRAPREAALEFERLWAERMGPGRLFDICFLGMGDDSHTASLFPGSPLLQRPRDRAFAAVDVPGKGWRLTTTAEGILQSGLIVVMAVGPGKAKALRAVLTEAIDWLEHPIQLLAAAADRVHWLVDPAAAGVLDF